MREALDVMASAADARGYLEGTMRLHRALVTAARIPVLDGVHEAIIALLQGALSRASFIEGHQPLLQHSLDVHSGIVEAIAGQDRIAFTKVMNLHNDDLIRADDPRRSPHVDH